MFTSARHGAERPTSATLAAMSADTLGANTATPTTQLAWWNRPPPPPPPSTALRGRSIEIDLRSFPPKSHSACGQEGVECGCSRQHARCLVLVMLTQHYLGMYVNWMHALTKINPDVDVRVISEDRASCKWLRSDGLVPGRSYVLRPKGLGRKSNGTATISVECNSNSTLPANTPLYGSLGFGRLMRRRALSIRRAVEHRCCVIWSDLDAVWLRDPIPYFRSAPERCTLLAPRGPCHAGELTAKLTSRKAGCFNSAVAAYFWDAEASVSTVTRRWVSLLPKSCSGSRDCTSKAWRLGFRSKNVSSLNDAITASPMQRSHVCALPDVNFPSADTLAWDQLKASEAASSPKPAFVVHSGMQGALVAQKVSVLRRSGMWHKGSNRKAGLGSASPGASSSLFAKAKGLGGKAKGFGGKAKGFVDLL